MKFFKGQAWYIWILFTAVTGILIYLALQYADGCTSGKNLLQVLGQCR